MSILSHLKRVVENGRKGLNIGIPTGMKALDEKIYGIQKGWITSVLGGSGSGKTTFVLYTVVYAALKEMLGDPRLNIIYYSLEMSSEILFAKLASLYIWDKHRTVVSYSEMLSLTGSLSDEKYKLVLDAYEWLEKVEKHFIVYDKSLSATKLNDHLYEFFKTKGTFVETGSQIQFKPHIEGEVYLALIDHMKLLSYLTPTVKPEIDKACKVAVYYRNLCKCSFYFVQQINRNSQDSARRAADMSELQLNDAQDSSDTIQASEVVIGLYFPGREKVAKARDYSVAKTGSRLRICQILKNRYGETELSFGCMLYGELGYWQQLPPASDMTDNDYETYLNYLSDITEDKQIEVDENYENQDKTPSFNFEF